MSVPVIKRVRSSGVTMAQMSKAAGVSAYRVGKVCEAAKTGDFLASFLVLEVATQVLSARGHGLQSDLMDFC
jgi:hypothetical protein